MTAELKKGRSARGAAVMDKTDSGINKKPLPAERRVLMKTAKAFALAFAILLTSVISTEAADGPMLRASDKFSVTPQSIDKPSKVVPGQEAKASSQPQIQPVQSFTGSVLAGKKAPVSPNLPIPVIEGKEKDVADVAPNFRPYPRLGLNPLIRGGLNEENCLTFSFKKLERFKGLQPGEGEEVREELEKMVAKGKFDIVYIKAIYQNGQPVVQYSEIMERGYRITENRAPTWEGMEPAVEIRLKRGVIVHIFLECANPGIYVPPVIPVKKPKTPDAPKRPEIPGTPPAMTEPPKLTRENKWKLTLDADLWGGAGTYESMRPRKGVNNKGYYWWTRGHLLPVGYQFSDTTSIHFGGYVFAAGGAGKAGNYSYSWNELFYGPSVKLYLEHSDMGLDVGVGGLRNRGFEKLYKSTQYEFAMETNLHYNNHARRDAGKKFLPKFEANIQGRMALKQPVHRHSYDNEPLTPKAWNNNFVDLNLLVHVYDLQVGKHFMVTPGINLDLGREFGNKVNFIKFGPALTFTAYDEQVAILYPPNLKFQGKGGDQIHWVSLSASADAVIKGWYRAHTKEVVGSMTPDGYRGSVLAKQFKSGNGKSYPSEPIMPTEAAQAEIPQNPSGVMVFKGSVLQKKLGASN